MRLTESYLALGIPEEAKKAAAVLGANYPGSKWYKRAYKLVREHAPAASRPVLMLTSLSIRNVVLIEALDLEFGAGLGVLTGEPGAGKSILLASLGLALGARAARGRWRQGEERPGVPAHYLKPRA